MVKRMIIASCLVMGQCAMLEQVQQSVQQSEIKRKADEIKSDFPIPLGAYYYEIKKWPLTIGKAKVIFAEYNGQGCFSKRAVKSIVSPLEEEAEKKYYLSFYFNAGIGYLTAEKNFETLAVKVNNEIKPVFSFYGERNDEVFFDRANKKIYRNGTDVKAPQDIFDDICDPMTLLVKMMTIPAEKDQKEIRLCKFIAPKIEEVVLSLSREEELFAGETKLPEGLFEFSKEVSMKIYYFPSKDGILRPTMKYKLCTKVPWLGSFTTEFKYHER